MQTSSPQRDDVRGPSLARSRWVVTSPSPAGVSDGIGDYSARLVESLSELATVDVALTILGRDPLVDPSRVRGVVYQYFPAAHSADVARWLDAVCRAGGSLVLTIHEYWPPSTWSPRRAMVRWMCRRQLTRLVRKASAVIVTQEIAARELRAAGVLGTTRLRIVPVGSNITRTDVAGPRDGGLVLFGQAAALQMPTVAAVARWMSAQSPSPTLTWISRSADEARRAWEQDAGPVPPTVTLLGGVPESVVSGVLARATLGLAPHADGVSARRGTCAALLQHGVPTVAYHGVATDSWLHGPGLYLVPDGRADVFVDAVAALWHDEATRSQLSQDAMALYAAHMDWSTIAAEYAAVMRPEEPLT